MMLPFVPPTTWLPDFTPWPLWQSAHSACLLVPRFEADSLAGSPRPSKDVRPYVPLTSCLYVVEERVHVQRATFPLWQLRQVLLVDYLAASGVRP